MNSSICRLCLSNIHVINNIFETDIKLLPEIIRRCTEVEIIKDDGLPHTVCEECIQRIVKFDVYRQQCQYSDSILKIQYLKTVDEKEIDFKPSNIMGAKLTTIRRFRNNKNTKRNENIYYDSNSDAELYSDSGSNDSDYKPDLNSNLDFNFKNDADSDNAPLTLKNSLSKKKCKIKRENHEKVRHNLIYTEQDYAILGKERKVRIYEMDVSMKKIIGINVYVCEICFKEFTSFFEYYDHQMVHDGESVFKCNKCIRIFSNRQDLVQHDAWHKVPCKICELEVLPKSMSAHLLIHTDIHKCMYCDTRHTSNASLEKHIKARHTGIKGFVCHICGKQSSCQSSMSRHMAYHSTERPYKCKYCDFCAKSLNIIQVHTSRKHFAEKCVCEICAKLFKSQPSLIQHMKRIHSTRKHICDICGKAFIERYNLNRHLKKHAGQRLHECKSCHKEFFTVRKLKEHMHSHRQGCVNCPKCGKEFFYKKYFTKHVFKCTKSEMTLKDN